MIAYLLGLATLPALVIALRASFAFVALLDSKWGISFEIKANRKPNEISDYTLRRDIWWERSWGPVFAGGWYREQPVYGYGDQRLFNRWVALGLTNGPAFMIFRKRRLDEAGE